jgi:hypothetical protein
MLISMGSFLVVLASGFLPSVSWAKQTNSFAIIFAFGIGIFATYLVSTREIEEDLEADKLPGLETFGLIIVGFFLFIRAPRR